MKKYNDLKNLIKSENKNISVRKGGRVYYALVSILNHGRAVTGGYTGTGSHVRKWICTSDVCRILDSLGIKYQTGNDAPRGGAAGEFVRVTSPAFLREVRKYEREQEAKIKTAKIELEKSREEVRQANSVKHLFAEEYNQIMVARLNDDLHGNARRNQRKRAREYAANLIANRYGLTAYGVDYVMTSPDANINGFISKK